MRTFPNLPLTIACALATLTTLPAQKNVDAVLFVRYGAGDLVLNRPLIDALLREPGVSARLREALGETFSQAEFTGESPAPHLPGTFQVQLRGTVHAGQWSNELHDAAVDAVVAHLQQRLTLLLHDEPRQQLSQRRDELRRRCADLASTRSALVQKQETAADRVGSLQQQWSQLEQQLLATRLDLATEERAKTHLELTANSHRSRLDALLGEAKKQRRERADLTVETATLQQRLGKLQQEPPPKPDTTRADMMLELTTLQQRLDLLGQESELQQARCDEQRRLLTATLEQWPALELSFERCKARAQGLEEELKGRQKQLAEAQDELRRATAEQTEELNIDLTVCRSLMNEVQGKLGRLEPVRVEVVRQR